MTGGDPLVAAVTMGYGHLRAAYPLADALGVPVAQVDRAPWAGRVDRKVWTMAHWMYGVISRASTAGATRRSAGRILDRITSVPRDSDRPAGMTASLVLHRLIGAGFGRSFSDLQTPMLATFYAPALAAERRGTAPVACLVTDTDCHRVWAPYQPKTTRILYLAPTDRVRRRLTDSTVSPATAPDPSSTPSKGFYSRLTTE